jgi:hypothetical protein
LEEIEKMTSTTTTTISTDLDEVEDNLLGVLQDTTELVKLIRDTLAESSTTDTTTDTTTQGKTLINNLFIKLETAHGLLVNHATLIRTYEPSQLQFNPARLRNWDAQTQTKHVLDLLKRTHGELTGEKQNDDMDGDDGDDVVPISSSSSADDGEDTSRRKRARTEGDQ